MNYYKSIPELTALVNKVATDVNEEFYFEPLDKKASNRNKLKQAEVFAQNVNLSQSIFSHLVDIIVTGEGYGWIGKINTAQIKEAMSKVMTVENKEVVMKMDFTDEDALKPRKYRAMASTTMENKFDEYEITHYVQRVGTDYKEFRRDEVVHYRFFDVDGRLAGFSCVGSIMTQLELLKFMWQNQMAVAKNGGHMDKILSIEDIDVNNPAFKRIETEVRKYNLNYMNRHGMMLLNGKVKVQELAQLDSMQFKEMGLYITGLIAMQWSIPRSSIPYIVGGANTKDDTGGNSEKGYWRNIEAFQNLFCNYINTQLFIPYFGVRMKFKKTYKHDELLEVQTEQTRLNNLTFMSNELAKAKKKFTSDFIIRYLNGYKEPIEEDDLEDHDPMMDMMNQNSAFRQGLQSNLDLQSSSDKKNVREKKKTEKVASQNDKGSPSGYGKEVQIKISEVKEDETNRKDKINIFEKEAREEIQIKERQRVSFEQFVKIYNEDKAFNKEPPRVFFSEQDGITHLAYRSTDWVYECFKPTNDISGSLFMNFIKIYRVDEGIMRPADGDAISGDMTGEA
jgi:hypothetical protein